MQVSFDLLKDKWVPVCWSRDRTHEEISLGQALLRANEIRAIDSPSPLVTVALHRLLIALVHRTQWPRNGDGWGSGPCDHQEWASLWMKGHGSFKADALDAYFVEKKDRFDLFSETHPFYQCPATCFCESEEERQNGMVPATKLVMELPSGDNKLLFDHTSGDGFSGLTPSAAARNLVAMQAYDLGGLIKRWGDTSAKQAPLAQGACVIIVGDSLFETIMLNLVPYNGAAHLPFTFVPQEDRPAWEAEGCVKPQARTPKGYLDYLTWQSRRVKLLPEPTGDGGVVVHHVLLGDGFRFPSAPHRKTMETMMAFGSNPMAQKGQDPWPAVEFREGFGLWRDSMAFLQSFGDEKQRPKTMDSLANLVAAGELPPEKTVPLTVYGLVSTKASLSQWCQERLSLPIGALRDDGLLECVAKAVAISKKIAEVLDGAVGTFLSQIRAHKAPEKLGKGQKQDTKNLLQAFSADRAYWSRLEVPFRELLSFLPSSSLGMDPDRLLLPWFETSRRAAWGAFQEVIAAAGEGGWGLKAALEGERAFNFGITTKCASYMNMQKEMPHA